VVASLSARTAELVSWRREGGINSTAEELYAEGFAQAKKNAKKAKPPPGILSNVPISVKDCIGLKDCLQTGGLAVRSLDEHRSEEVRLSNGWSEATAIAIF